MGGGNTMVDRWVDIIGFEGLYKASESGNIMSVKRKVLAKDGRFISIPEKELKKSIDSSGYLNVALSKDGKPKSIRVHRIIGELFIPNPNNYPQINHKNGIKSDNHFINLEWCTSSQNIQHSYDNLGRVSPNYLKSGSEIHNSKKVYCITLNKYYESARLAEIDLSISSGKVSAVCRGVRRHTNNLVFSFCNPPNQW